MINSDNTINKGKASNPHLAGSNKEVLACTVNILTQMILAIFFLACLAVVAQVFVNNLVHNGDKIKRLKWMSHYLKLLMAVQGSLIYNTKPLIQKQHNQNFTLKLLISKFPQGLKMVR